MAIPSIVPVEHEHGGTVVFMVAGAVELVLGATLAYLAVHVSVDDRDAVERVDATRSARTR